MSLRFADSFDHYDKAHFTEKWTSSSFGSNTTISAGLGRNGTSCLNITGGDSAAKALDIQAKLTVGLAVNVTTLQVSGSGNQFGAVWFTVNGMYQCLFSIDIDGFVHALTVDGSPPPAWGRSANATDRGRSTQAVRAGSYNYLEFQVIFSATAGQMIARLNGVTVLQTAQNINTDPNAAGGADTARVDFGAPAFGFAIFVDTPPGGLVINNSGQVYVDDLYITDGQGSVNNDFLGDVKVSALLPNGAGTATQFAVTGAATNWQAVNESPPNDDTSYVSSGTAGQQDLYAYPALTGASGNIAGVQVNLWARKDDAGTRTIEPLVTNSGRTSTAAGGQVSIGSTYQDWPVIMETNPANGNVAFTFSEIGGGNDEFGVQEVA